jgi:hypothetical protein
MNNNGWEPDTDARLRRWCIDDRRRVINSFPVTIRPIHTLYVAVAVISAPLLVTAVSPPSVIFAEGRRHVYTADHGD